MNSRRNRRPRRAILAKRILLITKSKPFIFTPAGSRSVYHREAMHLTRIARSHPLLRATLLALLSFITFASARAQDQVTIFSKGNAADRIRIAAAGFKGSGDLKQTFDSTLASDLQNAAIFDVVSRSIMPQVATRLAGRDRSRAVVRRSRIGFLRRLRNFEACKGSRLSVSGFLDDTHNTQYPNILAKQYTDDASADGARQIAHRFADEIILKLGGTPGIAETKIYFVKGVSGSKEIWEMDYDGANQRPVTHLGTVSLSPRVSPDNTRLAFSSLSRDGFQIKMYSLLLGRMVAFPIGGGTNLSPAWSPDNRTLAFSSSRSGDPEIYLSNSDGGDLRRITNFRGPDVSPVFNPRTGAQIAWISGRTGLPQLYYMNVDGSGVQRLTDGGYATAPSWSPNGQFIAYAWNRKYGPGAPGGQDIYVIEVATGKWIQLTHGSGLCDFPSWSPDGRHIVFANSPSGRDRDMRIETMLADGTDRHTLTTPESDMPNWSWR